MDKNKRANFLIRFLLIIIFTFSAQNALAQPPIEKSKKPPIQATVGFSLTNLFDINLAQKSFKATGYIWWQVNPPTPLYLPYDRTDVVNAKESIMKRHFIYDVKHGYYEAKVIATLNQEWDLRNFPFDKQALHIDFEDEGYDASRLQYIADQSSRVNPKLNLDDWKVISSSMVTSLDSGYSQATFTVNIERLNSAWLFFYMFIGTFMGACLCVLGFFTRLDSDIRFSLFLSSVFALVSNQYLLYNALPRTSYLTLSDKVQIATFILLVATIVLDVFLKKITERRRIKLGHYINNWIGSLICFSYISYIAYVVRVAVIS